MLTGGFFSNVGLALGDFAKQNRIVYLAGEPLTDALVWSAGNRYTFRLRPSNYMQAAMLAEEAAKLPAKTLGLDRAELRIRPIGRGGVQEAAVGHAART